MYGYCAIFVLFVSLTLPTPFYTCNKNVKIGFAMFFFMILKKICKQSSIKMSEEQQARSLSTCYHKVCDKRQILA